MSQWYLSKNGQALGPLAQERVVELIQSKDVGAMDLVYKAGSTEWLPISQVDTFRDQFKSSQEPQPDGETSSAKEWVLLKKVVTEKGSDFKQLGPFAKEQILTLIDQGAAQFKDYVWRQGMESWVKISQMPEFAEPLPSTPKIDVSLYNDLDNPQAISLEDKQDNLKHVQNFDRSKEGDASSEGDDVDEVNSDSPINSLDFVTETGVDEPIDTASSEVSLWSLQPPNTADLLKDLKSSENQKKASGKQRKVIASKDTKAKSSTGFQWDGFKLNVDQEHLQWAAVIGVVLFSLFFFYKSFQSNEPPIIYDQKQSESFGSGQLQQSSPQTSQIVESDQLKGNKFKNIKNVAPIVQPKNQKKIVERDNRRPASVPKKADEIRKRARQMAQSKKRPVARIKKSKKTFAKTAVKARKATGGKKGKSYYKQRDRKALFYSSLKGETLSVEIERQYKKLGNNKKAWSKYYRQWKKKVHSSLAKEIRYFPKKSEKYAYPSLLSQFKKDYNLLYQYGAVFNAKATKSRMPSGAPTNLKKVFSRHKLRAKSLGR